MTTFTIFKDHQSNNSCTVIVKFAQA